MGPPVTSPWAKPAEELVAHVEALSDRELLAFLATGLAVEDAPVRRLLQRLAEPDRVYDDIVRLQVRRQLRHAVLGDARAVTEAMIEDLPTAPGWRRFGLSWCTRWRSLTTTREGPPSDARGRPGDRPHGVSRPRGGCAGDAPEEILVSGLLLTLGLASR
jgi:hypothetical protein